MVGRPNKYLLGVATSRIRSTFSTTSLVSTLVSGWRLLSISLRIFVGRMLGCSLRVFNVVCPSFQWSLLQRKLSHWRRIGGRVLGSFWSFEYLPAHYAHSLREFDERRRPPLWWIVTATMDLLVVSLRKDKCLRTSSHLRLPCTSSSRYMHESTRSIFMEAHVFH